MKEEIELEGRRGRMLKKEKSERISKTYVNGRGR